jgi:hypothetical protein
LPDLIDQVFATAKSADHTRLTQNLSAAGWSEQQRDLFRDSWRLRTPPRAFSADLDLPKLTPQILVEASVDIARLKQVNYEIDLSESKASCLPPTTISAIVDKLGETLHG